MEERVIGSFLSRIMCGYYIFTYAGKRYKLEYPNLDLKYQAEILAQEIYDDWKYQEWPTLKSVIEVLVDQGLWEYHFEMDIKQLEKSIEDIKVDIYKNYLNDKKLKQLKRTLYQHDNKLSTFLNKKHQFDYITIEGFAESAKTHFLLSNSILDQNNQYIFLKDDADNVLLQRISSIVSENSIGITTFKKIARSNLWNNYWGTKKEDVFDGPSIRWTDEQKTLVRITKMYDSAREHPECPPDDVFDDDDAFEGWMILERRKNEKSKIENRLEKSLPAKLKNAGEVFLVAGSQKEAEQIYGLNDAQGLGIIKERNRILQTQHEINETNLPDIRRDITMQNNELMKNQARK